MNKLIIISLICFCWFVSCDNTNSENEGVSEDCCEQKEMIIETKADAIYPALFQELKNLITKNGAVGAASAIKGNVYIVYFSEKDEDCYVTIYQSLCYYKSYFPESLPHPSYKIDGFVLMDNKMVAFYNVRSRCNRSLVDAAKLDRGKAEGFPDEGSEIALNTTYDGLGKEYKILNNGKDIELVFNGYK